AVSFIGAERGLEAKLLPERGEKALLLTMHSVQGAGLLQRLRVLLWELPLAVLVILKQWRANRPQVVVGVGGYASVAGVIAALVARIPVVLYEQNAMPGMVNRLLYRFCKKMMLGFASAQQHLPKHAEKAVLTGNVIRQAIQDVSWQAPARPCLLVVGGSQGAMFLNETVPLACVDLAEQGLSFTVIHLVGAGDGRVKSVSDVYQQAGIAAEVQAFSNDMPALFQRASLLMARAGAMTVGEAAAVGMPAFFVPLPSAADQHQYHNALALAEVGAAEIINQQDCDAQSLAEKLKNSLFDAKKLQAMSILARKACVQDAQARQIKVLAEFLDGVTT
ncbi:MAG: UDP-N-acetylglucosamine--N-acetylmuramyl-(pentapeptide) pyrophosphoryl-undecaprenol N-acetylglucosamine transferase, partial [Ghiorsea sp.]